MNMVQRVEATNTPMVQNYFKNPTQYLHHREEERTRGEEE
jgi:hypothetical protein